MLTRAELVALLITCEERHGWEHPLTQRVREELEAPPPETVSELQAMNAPSASDRGLTTTTS